MSGSTYITEQAHLDLYCRELMDKGVPEFGLHITIEDGQRTPRQRRATHVYFEKLGDALNDAGWDMKRVLDVLKKGPVDIPWTKESVKKYLWKPVMEAMYDQKSTTEQKRSQISKVYETLTRIMTTKFGVYVPFPQNQYPED